ncbi:F-box only protein 34 [Anguilla rostrata]|uniref:F-box only protein 34 n=1 Tax=Anguilla rostrata TaxID=7938 RepID=UPI0030D0FF58
MPGRCEYIMSSCRPAPYREPRKPPSTIHPAWRFATMHLKPYPKFQKKELQLESSQDDARGLHAGQQGALRAERPARQPCSPGAVPGNGTASRQPLSAISSNNAPCRGGAPAPKPGGEAPSSPWGRKGSSLPVSLLLLSSGPEQDGSLTLYQGDGGDGQLDIWAVIKPGNTKEKIAIFAGQQCARPSGPGSPATGGSRGDEAPASLRTVSMKAKGCWEVEGSVAKRRKCSSDPDKRRGPEQLPQGGGGAEREAGEAEPLRGEGEGEGEGEGQGEGGEEGGKTLSVVEMVAYLEQRANEQQVDCSKPLHPRSLVSAPKAPPLEDQPGGPEAWEGREEEGESVRVLDMVAKLESECLKRQSEREGGGDLSRSNSLRRNVCRVLLAGAGPGEGPGAEPRPDLAGARRCDAAPVAPAEAESGAAPGVEPERCESAAEPCVQTEEEREEEAEEEETAMVESGSRAEHREEPLPGMLFCFSPLQEQPLPTAESSHEQEEEEETGAKEEELEELLEEEELEKAAGVGSPERVPFPLRRLVSHRFLEMRFKIQLLLEPQQYMALLPHHIMVKIFSLLPTQTLAALKCTCHYFKFVIESYGVRPADSRWVCDPRYRDDPCKQCKRRYGRGDVSLCRWHHKPYCQALPYGPGYWMCCHGSHKDTPGCNVGLHDNRWVPAFHSINMPIYKKARESEEDS